MKNKLIFLVPIGVLCAIGCVTVTQKIFGKDRGEASGKVLVSAGTA